MSSGNFLTSEKFLGSGIWSDGQTSGGGQTKAESERGRAPLILHRESRKTMGFTW